MRHSRLNPFLLTALAALSVTLPAAAQPSSDPTPPAAPTIQVTTREIAVDVTVTDDHGNPVHGLTRADFTVKENNHPQPIRGFQENRVNLLAPASPARRPLPPNVYTNYQSTPASGPVQILLLDSLNNPLALSPASLALTEASPALEQLHWVQQSILGYLHRMAPGTQIAVFWLADTGLHLLQGFTSDRSTLFRVADIPRLDAGAPPERWTRNWITIDALAQIAQYAAPVQGRKNLLWFTPGMPIRLLRDGGYAWAGSSGGGMGQVHRIMDVFDLFTTEQIAVYPIDPSMSPHLGGATLLAEEVAQSTGGLAIYNTSELAGAISAAINHGSEYYTLTYAPPGSTDDGHYHRIQVNVDRPGLHLSYRRGYNAEAIAGRAPLAGPALIKASMEGKAPPATTLLFDAKVTPADAAIPAAAPPNPTVSFRPEALSEQDESKGQKGPSGETRSPPAKPSPPNGNSRFLIRYLIPQPQLGLQKQPDGSSTGAVEFDAVGYDVAGRRVALLSQTLNLHLTPAELDDFNARPLQFTQTLELPRGQSILRLGILDTASGKAGTLEIPLTTPLPDTVDHGTIAPPPCPPRCALPQPATPNP